MAKHFPVTISEIEVPVQVATGTYVVGRVGHNVTTLTDGRRTLATANTREILSTASVPCEFLVMSPLTTNTGVVAVGGTTVVATATQRQGISLISGDPPLTLAINNLNKVWLDSIVINEGISYIVLG